MAYGDTINSFTDDEYERQKQQAADEMARRSEAMAKTQARVNQLRAQPRFSNTDDMLGDKTVPDYGGAEVIGSTHLPNLRGLSPETQADIQSEYERNKQAYSGPLGYAKVGDKEYVLENSGMRRGDVQSFIDRTAQQREKEAQERLERERRDAASAEEDKKVERAAKLYALTPEGRAAAAKAAAAEIDLEERKASINRRNKADVELDMNPNLDPDAMALRQAGATSQQVFDFLQQKFAKKQAEAERTKQIAGELAGKVSSPDLQTKLLGKAGLGDIAPLAAEAAMYERKQEATPLVENIIRSVEDRYGQDFSYNPTLIRRAVSDIDMLVSQGKITPDDALAAKDKLKERAISAIGEPGIIGRIFGTGRAGAISDITSFLR